MPSASSLRKSTSAPKLQGGPYPENAYSLSKSSKDKSHFLSFQGLLNNWSPEFERMFSLLKTAFSSKSPKFLPWKEVFSCS